MAALLTLLFPVFVMGAVDLSKLLPAQMKDTDQVLVVSAVGGTRAHLEMFVKEGDKWKSVKQTPAVIGLKGFAALGAKIEGDKKTPSGIFGFTTAWGYSSMAQTKMPFKQVDDEDKVIDDVNSDQYNQWVRGATSAKSFEKMKRNDGLYEWGVVIDYNLQPVVKGKGSAIFLHVWRAADKGTAGCVAVPRVAMIEILKLLDPAKNPKIVLNPGGL